MPTTLPQSVREHMGEQVAADFSRWFAENVQQELVTNDEYRKVLSRLDVLEERFDHVEERFDRVDERLDRMEERFDRMEERFGNRFEEVNQRFEGIDTKLDRMNDRILSMTRWIIGLIALFGTMVTVLLAVAQFGS
jgi:tetrahydromethanopterin S-methyltransferase subunit G